MTYVKQNWADGPSGHTPITAARLNHIEDGLIEITADLLDRYTLDALDRVYASRARTAGGAAAVSYADAAELPVDWGSLTGWQTSPNAQVSGNRLYAVDGSTGSGAGAIRAYPVAPGEKIHLTTVLHWRAGGTSDSVYVGIDLGATAPAGDTDYQITIDIDENVIAFTIRDLANPASCGGYYILQTALSAAGKTINNLIAFSVDSRGLGGHSIGPIVVTRSRQPVRSKTVASQVIEGNVHRVLLQANFVDPNAWRIQLPKTYDPRIPSPVVIWCHQSVTGDADDPWTETRMRPLTTALSDAGYIFASANDGGDRWGNAASLANYLALAEWIRDEFNTGPVFAIGVSMGALSVLNAINHRIWPTLAAAAIISGACDLDDFYAGNTGSFAAAIRTAYGVAPDGSDYETQTAGWNPVEQDGKTYRGVPVKFFASNADTTVSRASNADAMAALLAPYGRVEVVTKTGAHLDAAQYPPTEIIDFFNAYH